MKILILGAGQVGSTVAANLASEANDITLVDTDSEVLHELRERLDIQTICGKASHPSVLIDAGIEDADLLIAVTNSDEVNMVACQIAHSLFHTPTKIARVRSREYLKYRTLFGADHIPVDVLISPEELISRYIERLIEYPGALQVLDFAEGKAQLVGMRAHSGGLLIGHEIRTLSEHIPGVDSRVAAIFRRGKGIIPQGDQVIEADDEVFFIAARKDIKVVMGEMRKLDKNARRIMLAGGGNIGHRLARALENKHQLKVLERNQSRARYLSEKLSSAIILCGDSADEDLLLEENVDQMDMFCSLTNDDETNVLSALLAKKLGAKKVMALINRPAYVDLVESLEAIDVAISPQQITIGVLLTYVRRGDVVAVHSLRRGAAEAIEIVAHGDSKTSRVVGKTIEELVLPEGVSVGAIVRGDEVLMAHHDIEIQTDDHLIIFLLDKYKIPLVEKLFQVSVTFF